MFQTIIDHVDAHIPGWLEVWMPVLERAIPFEGVQLVIQCKGIPKVSLPSVTHSLITTSGR